MATQDFKFELVLFHECCEKALGEPFDQLFERYLDNINSDILWSSSISFFDRYEQMSLDQLQNFAYLGELRFYVQSDLEDGSFLFEGQKFESPLSYGVYSLSDEEDVSYIGDDVYNIQCLINNVICKASQYEYDIDTFSITKTIEGTPYFISIGYFEGLLSINGHLQCKPIIDLLLSIFEAHGLIKKEENIDDDTIFIQFQKKDN